MIPKKSGDIKEADLVYLVENKIAEGKTLEYKRDLPKIGREAKPEEKAETLADITSFANSSGGDIIYGIDEERQESKKTGLAGSLKGFLSEAIEEVIQSLRNTCLAGVEPRVPGLEFLPIPLSDGSRALVIRIPRSFAGPHMVKLEGRSVFWGRTSGGKHKWDVQEIRTAFSGSEEVPKRIRAFQADRISAIMADEIETDPLMGGPLVLLHVMPFSAFAGQIEELEVSSKSVNEFGLLGFDAGINFRYTIEGLLIHSSLESRQCLGYCHIHRTGIVEHLAIHAFAASRINPGKFQNDVSDACMRAIKSLDKLGCPGPYGIGVALLRARGKLLDRNDPFTRDGMQTAIKKDVLMLPTAVLNADSEGTPELKPIFDALWRVFGYPGRIPE